MQNIIKFLPIYKEKIWGGRKLHTHLSRNLPEGKIGESWEISDYGDDISIICNGELQGMNFREAYLKYPKEILGENISLKKGFPLLVKIIDASENLSIQVHPDDEYTLKYDKKNSGKKEAWYILQTDKDSSIICGFSVDTTKTDYQKLVKENRAENILQKLYPKNGSSYLINPGTIHGIGGGNLILEIQQSSDSTYRVYDYGRLDNGKPRELHLDKALDVLNFSKSNGLENLTPVKIDEDRSLLTENDKFRLELFETEKKKEVPAISLKDIFQILHVVEGELEIDSISFKKGDTFLITAKGMRQNIFLSPKEKLKLVIACSKEYSSD
ncbi:MAG: class I mannose-6-phosphate isomerase [Leptospiraceae bacterium]|nr:class I mannose-6-phosphate isomerase [Leptospiraceae bacterium]NUM40476.1 class I mannose-6-phosphate isomerase [Leptospiraceae bacterium]